MLKQAFQIISAVLLGLKLILEAFFNNQNTQNVWKCKGFVCKSEQNLEAQKTD